MNITRDLIAAAIRDGCDHVVESNIEDFFDGISWVAFEQALARHLPLTGALTRLALMAIVSTPLEDAAGRP